MVIVMAVASSLAGIILAVVYRPGEWGWLRTLHAATAAIAVISSVAARVVGAGGRVRLSRRGGVLVVALVLVVGAAFGTGSIVAWRGGQPSDRGMFLDKGHRVESGKSELQPADLVSAFVIHTVLGLLSFLLVAGPSVRQFRRRPGEP
jgi:hypothetical protein